MPARPTLIRADLLSSRRRQDAPSQRRIMRNYGLTFIPLPGEPVETDPGQPSASPETPPPSSP